MKTGVFTASSLLLALGELLEQQLGTYTTPTGNTTPAIVLDNPPSSWRVQGLEVILNSQPELEMRAVHEGVGQREAFHVRLIGHNGANVAAATSRVVGAFDTTVPRMIPGDEQLGIIAQYTMLIRS